ncbi:hypothetical protein Theba_0129 [Mesotoga prima MesG1.Ag.4.2]|uniref:Imm-5-like domain-containing protein n=1 Tax=Mesotoga prima MesG1.Ag.4.2 TaxID=660470 RepID=I2F1S3_9BACT|nr:hypothetical protein [Mesotoga prima]AFK05876.1 hypothetical protein Theba_0129 [Mesotoga prima MesG1.Ag.4.2]
MPRLRKMLNDLNASYIKLLMRQIETQSKTTLANWAIDYSERIILPLWLKYCPDDLRPKFALDSARLWLNGKIQFQQAKKKILRCHEAAREAESNHVAHIAARAIAQSASTIHAARHCIGLALYGALAVAYDELGTEAPWERLEIRAEQECEHMLAALCEISVVDEPNPANIDWYY